ncbi:MAG TPA: flagellar hook-basal body protein [Clostridiaceae bacterium]|nr:flagellar hook-basal body protein [Clostridiaceae bacterium]
MLRGLYTSGWSMMANSKKMDIIANNLANVNTNAFKKDTVIFESFPEMLTKRINDTRSRLNPSGIVGTMELSSDVGEIFTYYNQGALTSTENRLDFAIKDSDSAFFTVQALDEEGNAGEYYTRDGAFTLDENGRLMTMAGYAVLGENGHIYLSSDDFTVERDGTIVQNGEVVDRLLIREFTDTTTLRKVGLNLVARTDETQEREFTGQVQQGFLEQSNVNVVKEMVDMINVMRAYEANQKALQAIDGTLELAVNQVGAVK